LKQNFKYLVLIKLIDAIAIRFDVFAFEEADDEDVEKLFSHVP